LEAARSEEELLGFVVESPGGHNDVLFNFGGKYLETRVTYEPHLCASTSSI
jgi:hypothetical protein